MKHSIMMRDTESDWNEALPLGNGVYGAMTYYKSGALTSVLNHYEVYYTLYERYSRAYQEKLKKGGISFGESRSYEELLEAAKNSIRDLEQEPYLHYRRTIWPTADVRRRPAKQSGVSHPGTGEVQVRLGSVLHTPEHSFLRLDIEDAALRFRAQCGEHWANVEQKMLTDADALLTRYTQSEPGMIEEIRLRYPLRRNHEGFTCELHQLDRRSFDVQVSFYPQGEDREKFPPFTFAVCVKLDGAEAQAELLENEIVLRLPSAGESFTTLVTVVTELTAKKPAAAAHALAEKTQRQLQRQESAHKSRWEEFFGKSTVTLPDKFLEKLWVYNLYLLSCCSGKGGKRKEQACGLNGLWDIRQPTIWGSLWYWDVNIQAAFWPVYTANHMELAQVFNEGLLSYVEFARKRAKEFYHMPGVAMDYPHAFYNCMWPWCAQFLWWYYEYTLDQSFLRSQAYPLFLDLLKFAQAFSHVGEDGRRVFFPDVSPEQGPLTQNSVITVSTVKYLAQLTRKAAEILGKEPETQWVGEFLSELPDYPTVQNGWYGKILRDSDFTPVGQKLRHPSVLMPTYPIGEMSLHSDPKTLELARRTLNFAEDNTELGVFGYGWLSSAASRLGQGDTALRLLYEKGLDLILRANGMGSEETERFINHCCVNKPPLYYPFMMECVGETAAAINEMLLQSYDGAILLFPALPKGEPEILHEAGREEEPRRRYAAWEDCSFTGLLAKGAFSVSAQRRGGKTVSVEIESLGGSYCRVYEQNLPNHPHVLDSMGQELFVSFEEGILSFPTVAGECYSVVDFEAPETADSFTEDSEDQEVNIHTAHTGRRVYLGKDADTLYTKTLDSFLREYYVANEPRRRMTTCAYSFGCDTDPEEEIETLDTARGADSEVAYRCVPVTADTMFTAFSGYGFEESGTLRGQDSRQVDALRRDCILGEETARFLIELPKGRYDALVVCGSALEATHIRIVSPNGEFAAAQRMLKAGEFAAVELPMVHPEDGNAVFEFQTDSRFAVCALFLNKDYAAM